jgi:hypothetical protein
VAGTGAVTKTTGWNDLTPEEIEAKVRREHGDAIWEIVKRTLDTRGDVKPGAKPEKATRVGRKPKYSKGFGRIKPQGESRIPPGRIRTRSGAPSPAQWYTMQRKKSR